MAQVTIYLQDETASRVDRAARREGLSRSAWVKRAVESQLAGRLPESFFSVLGTWEDDRDPRRILADIRAGFSRRTRRPRLR